AARRRAAGGGGRCRPRLGLAGHGLTAPSGHGEGWIDAAPGSHLPPLAARVTVRCTSLHALGFSTARKRPNSATVHPSNRGASPVRIAVLSLAALLTAAAPALAQAPTPAQRGPQSQQAPSAPLPAPPPSAS